MHLILIRRTHDDYFVLADSGLDPERPISARNVSREAVIELLINGNLHQQDIGDALAQADQDWVQNREPVD